MCEACDELFRRRKAERLKAEEQRVIDGLIKALNANQEKAEEKTVLCVDSTKGEKHE